MVHQKKKRVRALECVRAEADDDVSFPFARLRSEAYVCMCALCV